MKTNAIALSFTRQTTTLGLFVALGFGSLQTTRAQAPGCDLPGALLPPPTGTHHFAGDVRAPGSAVVLRDLALSLASSSLAPPAAGTTQVATCTMSATGRLSTDNGSSFAPFAASADVSIRTTAHAPGEPFDTEMLMLNLTLPGGVMLRESPTRASTGKTSLRTMPDGTCRIDSFFDVFTEVRVNAGEPWAPAPDANPCPMYGCPQELATSAPNLPPSNGVCRGERPLRFASPIGTCVLRNLTISEPTMTLPPPPPGGSQTVASQVTVSGELSLDGGATFSPFATTANTTRRVASFLDDGATRYFDTEMLQFDVSGSTLPGGLMLRESPTRASTGRTSLRTMPTGDYRVSSFFDIWTEISLDRGTSWLPASNGACRVTQDGTRREHHFLTNCFPQAGSYACDEDQDTGFSSTPVVLRRIELRPGSRPLEMPAAGTAATTSLSGKLDCDLSVDGGTTFTRVRVDATGECSIGAYAWSHGGEERPMESLSLNFSCPGPTPVMVRESPTRASTGRHTVRTLPDGSCMISSFFDIWTEISLDGGGTWTPADAPLTCMLLPYVEADNIFVCSHLPPRDGSYETRKSAEPVVFSNNVRVRNIKLGKFPRSSPPPEECDDASSLDLTTEAELEVSTDNGNTWASHRCTGTVAVRITPVDFGGHGSADTCDTELTSLSLSGGTLPAAIRLRESPTLPSKGQTRLMEEEGIYYYFRIDSFFDVFTELSVDDGTNWSPAQNACHLELHAKPEGPRPRSAWLPLAVQYRESDFNFALPYGLQSAISSFSLDCSSPLCSVADGRAPAPAPGSTLTRTTTVPVACDVTLDGGVSSHHASGMATLTVLYSDMTTDGGGWTALTGEVLQCDVSLTSSTLPGQVMVRESPTRASLGRCASRPNGSAYHIDSFFDIFTELSLDGGATWTPACKTLHLQTLPAGGTGAKVAGLGTIKGGTFNGGPGNLTLRCATGQHIKSAKLFVRKQGTDQHDYLVPLPSPAMISPISTDATLQLEYSPDGTTFSRIEAPVFYRYELKEVMVDSIQMSCTNEVTVFDASGGSFPPGVMLREKKRPGRESPTLASLGRTTSTQLPGGQFHVDSFFDVFTELSVDGGHTWHEFDLPLHFELEPTQTEAIADTSHWLPAGRLQLPPGDPDFDLLFTDGSSCSFFDIFTEIAGPGTLPELGLSSSMATQASIHLTLSPAGAPPGSPPLSLTCPATVITQMTRNQPPASDGTSHFDTEMLALDLTSLPGNIRVRESPTKASLGRTSLRTASGGGGGGGGFAIDSFFDVFLELSIDGGTTWCPSNQPYRVVFATPEIAVSGPDGNDLADGSAVVECGQVVCGTTTEIVFHFTCEGTTISVVEGLTIDGPDATDFSVSQSPPSSVEPGASASFVVAFSPNSPGDKIAVLHLVSNDADESPFDITLTGRAFAATADDDGDGITNEQEIHNAACGFDPLVDDSKRLTQLRADGFYRATDMHALAMGQPLLERDPATGHFHLSLGFLRAPDLTNWSPLLQYTPVHDPATGRIDIEFAPAPGATAEFYRVFGDAPPP